MSKGHAKGSSFEREMCKLLGLWWTGNQRDDVFWRSSNSGGRATVRSRSGRGTFGQHGDVQATDPIGQPLMDLCTIEMKRGYGHTSIGDVLDKPGTMKPQAWELWIEQAIREHKEAGSDHWMLITRRDRREALVFIPLVFKGALIHVGVEFGDARPCMTFRLMLRKQEHHVWSTTLRSFLASVTPEDVRKLRQYK